MAQSYKVFINNFFILFTESLEHEHNVSFLHDNTNFQIISSYNDLINYLISNKYQLKCHIIFESGNICLFFCRFKSNFKFIIASGGVVQNTKKQILFICKNNIWDLPKGKVESNETIESAGIREVVEETSISDIRLVNRHPYSTYHIYKDKFNSNQLTFKETKWFFMNAESSLLKPQIEEGISDVKWISFDKIHTLVMFESVKDPIIFFVG